MLFADSGDVPAWLYFVFGAGGAAACAAIAWYLKWDRDQRKEARKDTKEDRQDALQEYKELLDLERARCDEALARLQRKVDSQDSYVKSLLEQVGDAKRSEAEQRGRVARMELELQHVIQELREVQAVTGKYPKGVTYPCQIIADKKGIIKWASGSSMDMFGWLPQELQGRHIGVLMPEETMPIHRRAFDLAVTSGKKLDPARLIISKGLTKKGKRFSVSINLSVAESIVEGSVYITAEIRRYGDSDAVIELYGPKTPPDGIRLEDTVKAEK